MSMGYGGTARLALQDDKVVVYEYAPYNLNDPEYMNNAHIYDGIITINKASLVEPEFYKKIKRMPGGKKKYREKRIRRDVDYRALLGNRDIIIENSRCCWCFVGSEKDIGMIAMKITYQIFEQYQDNGIVPEIVSIHY